jgi:hypothetical protein
MDKNVVSNENGELSAFLNDMKEESADMMKKLVYIDSILINLQNMLISDDGIKKEYILSKIKEIRGQIGSIEQEDEMELGEEEETDTLLSKLKKWVDQIV